jgi:hypothetical protein
VKASRAAWALARALRLTIAIAVIALVLATTLTGAGAERLATTAYLAAIFAAVILVVQRLLPTAADEAPPAQWTAAFPTFLAFIVGVAVLLGTAAALASEPGWEAALFVACIAIVALAVLARVGALAALNAKFTEGGILSGATRYSIAAGVCALALAALLPSDAADAVAEAGYRLLSVGMVLFALSLFATTAAGAAAQRRLAEGARLLDRLAREFVFQRTARAAAIVAALVMIPASVLLAPYSEPFAVAAYVAAVAAAFGVAMECRRLRG